MSQRLLFLLLCAFTLLSMSALAVDGVVLINQASVNAAGFPYHITQSGSYKLSSNLSAPSGINALVINADNVVLDLNGFSITSTDTTCTAAQGSPVTSCVSHGASGVFSFNNNITIINGSISGMSLGVGLEGSGNLVESVHFSGNNTGAEVNIGVVRRSTFISNLKGLVVLRGVAQENIAALNSVGVRANRSNVSGNTLSSNDTGLLTDQSNYGNNSFMLNAADVSASNGSTSQNNNNCSGTVC